MANLISNHLSGKIIFSIMYKILLINDKINENAIARMMSWRNGGNVVNLQDINSNKKL